MFIVIFLFLRDLVRRARRASPRHSTPPVSQFVPAATGPPPRLHAPKGLPPGTRGTKIVFSAARQTVDFAESRIKEVMHQRTTITIAAQPPGQQVWEAGTMQSVGRLSDVIIQPTQGTILGLIVQTAQDRLEGCGAGGLQINAAGLVIAPGPRFDTKHVGGPLAAGGKVRGELIGASVVSEEGKLLGHVSEIHLTAKRPGVTYRDSRVGLHSLFNSGFYLPGDRVCAYSRAGARLIVPARTPEFPATPSADSGSAHKARPQSQGEDAFSLKSK